MSDSKDTSQNPWTEDAKATFKQKEFSKHFDPCQEAANKSLKCLHRNPGNKELCNDYFRAYRECKAAWQQAKKEESKVGVGKWF